LSDEQNLIDKLKRIEALFSGATTEGEKVAAGNAIDKIQNKLKGIQKKDPPVEYKFTLSNEWSKNFSLHYSVDMDLNHIVITDNGILL